MIMRNPIDATPQKLNAYDIMRDNRRNKILDTAKKLIIKNGIESLNMQILAKKSEISRVTLYKYFNSLDEIIFAIQIKILQSTSSYSSKQYESYQTLGHNANSYSLDSFLQLTKGFFEYAFKNRDDYVFICLFDVYTRNRFDKTELDNEYDLFIKSLPIFQEGFENLRKSGLIRQDLDIERASFLLSSLITSMVNRMILLDKKFNRNIAITNEQIIDDMMEMFYLYIKA